MVMNRNWTPCGVAFCGHTQFYLRKEIMKSSIFETATSSIENSYATQMAYQEASTKILRRGGFTLLSILVFIIFTSLDKFTHTFETFLLMAASVLIVIINSIFAFETIVNMTHFRRMLQLTGHDKYSVIGNVGITLCLLPFGILATILLFGMVYAFI